MSNLSKIDLKLSKKRIRENEFLVDQYNVNHYYICDNLEDYLENSSRICGEIDNYFTNTLSKRIRNFFSIPVYSVRFIIDDMEIKGIKHSYYEVESKDPFPFISYYEPVRRIDFVLEQSGKKIRAAKELKRENSKSWNDAVFSKTGDIVKISAENPFDGNDMFFFIGGMKNHSLEKRLSERN